MDKQREEMRGLKKITGHFFVLVFVWKIMCICLLGKLKLYRLSAMDNILPFGL